MLDTYTKPRRAARVPKDAVQGAYKAPKAFYNDTDSNNDLSDEDQMPKPAGTPSTRSRQGKHADQQQGSKQAAASRARTRRHADTQQEQPDVIMIDSSSDEEGAVAAAPAVQRPRGRPPKAAAAAAPARELVISDSEQEDGSSSEGEFGTASSGSEAEDDDMSDAVGDAAAAAASSDAEQEGSSEEEEEEGAAADTDSESEEEPFQLARGKLRGSRSAAPVAAASTAGSGRTPKGAATTPKRSMRGAAAEAAATPRSTRRGPAAAAAAEVATPRSRRAAPATPSGRPVRSCTKAAAEQPSLATPLAKLSLRSSTTPQPSAGKQLRSSTAAAAAPASSKARQRSSSKAGSSSASASSKAAVGAVLPSVEVDGEVFGPGDDVYLALDDFDGEDDEEEACEVCGSSSSKRGNAILECSTCLRGFHLCCLVPRLKAVPDGDWLCADCNAGRVPPPPNKLVTRWQKLLYAKDQLALVHVLGCMRGKAPNGTEEDQLLVRYYLLPQQTHTGRLSTHGARELFLGCKTFVEPAHAVVGRAYVHHPQHFEEQEEEGNDVFLCAYEYEEDWKRFKLRKKSSSDGNDYEDACPTTPMLAGLSRGFDESGSDSGSEVDSEAEGEDYKPDYGPRGKSTGKRRRGHGQLPAALAAAAGRFAGLGATELGQQQQLEQRDAFARLHASMSLACVPASLPCRQEERSRLQGFVSRALHEDGGILYICGVPGTGKTALVKEVLGGLRDEARGAGSQLVSINCLQLPSPQHVFSRLWEKLSGQHMGPARARDALMQLFGVGAGAGSSRRRYSTIIVLDEIDMLMTKDQAVLYQLFDWPSQPNSRLAIIGISNTHDLDQRVLPRIASRLDQAKLAFAPYSAAQLIAIVQDRLAGSGVGGAVDEAAVQVACRKVAAETGDVRRALEMLRRAVEIARQQHLADLVASGKPGVAAAAAAAAGAGSSHRHGQQQQQQPQGCEVEWQDGDEPLVERSHTRQAQSEMFSALHHQLLRSRSCWEKLLLVAVVVEARATGRSAVVIQSVAERAANSIASLVDLTPPTLGVLQHCLVRLAGVRLLLSDGVHVKAQVALNVDKDDLALAIKDDVRLARLQLLL